MKKFGILLAILALVLASLACQTLSGGGDSGAPELPVPSDNGGSESQLGRTATVVATHLVSRASFPCPTARQMFRK